MLSITRTLQDGDVTLELLNTLDPEKVIEYAERSLPWINNLEINQYLGRQGSTMEQTLQWYRSRPSEIEVDRTFAIWVDNIHVGSCGIHSIDVPNRHACLGILIGDTGLHSKGIGTKAMIMMCRHAFWQLELRKVWLHVTGNNPRGINCYHKCGFHEVGRKTDHAYRAGILQDEVTMELFSEDFNSSEEQCSLNTTTHIVR